MRSPQQTEEVRLSAILKKQLGPVITVEKYHLILTLHGHLVLLCDGWEDKHTHTKNTHIHTLSPSSVCLSRSLPLLSCDVFWPDTMAPGRQWHDHRKRGQKGHSTVVHESGAESGCAAPLHRRQKLFWCQFHLRERRLSLFVLWGWRLWVGFGYVVGLCFDFRSADRLCNLHREV